MYCDKARQLHQQRDLLKQFRTTLTGGFFIVDNFLATCLDFHRKFD
jgi:hypothetical protein